MDDYICDQTDIVPICYLANDYTGKVYNFHFIYIGTCQEYWYLTDANPLENLDFFF